MEYGFDCVLSAVRSNANVGAAGVRLKLKPAELSEMTCIAAYSGAAERVPPHKAVFPESNSPAWYERESAWIVPACPNDASDESVFETVAREPHASFAELNEAASCVRFAFVSSARSASKRVLSDVTVEVCVAPVVEVCVTTTFRTSSVLEEHAFPASARTISNDALFARFDVFMSSPRRQCLTIPIVLQGTVCARRHFVGGGNLVRVYEV